MPTTLYPRIPRIPRLLPFVYYPNSATPYPYCLHPYCTPYTGRWATLLPYPYPYRPTPNQVGNAVSPRLAERLGLQILRALAGVAPHDDTP